MKSSDALVEIIATLIEVVKAGGSMGVPAGHMYGMLMIDLSLENFQKLMDLVVKTGMVRHKHHCYYYVEK